MTVYESITCITIRNDIQPQRRSPRIHLIHMLKKDLLHSLALQNIVACYEISFVLTFKTIRANFQAVICSNMWSRKVLFF